MSYLLALSSVNNIMFRCLASTIFGRWQHRSINNVPSIMRNFVHVFVDNTESAVGVCITYKGGLQ